MSGVYWADVSHYQTDAAGRPIAIDDSYPHQVFAFRSSSGDRRDAVFVENARNAKAMLNDGRLVCLIVYYFYWPDQDSAQLHRQMLEEAGLWRHPRVVSMVDVESAGGRIRGDVSRAVNAEIDWLRDGCGDSRRVIGYYNPRADPGLWPVRPPDLNLIVPHYNYRPGDSYTFPGRFAHQYGDAVPCAPWGPCDGNYTALDLPSLLEMLGIEDDSMSRADEVLHQLRGDDTDSLAGNTGWRMLAPVGGHSVALGRQVDRLSVVEALAQLVFEATLRVLPYRNGQQADVPETVLGHAAAAHGAGLDALAKLDQVLAGLEDLRAALAEQDHRL
ncbi:hypothetical protein [Nocardia puris]|uniref:Glycosyl hydrolase family 25 n=1 Tax=Nocardia puris TaxID=208602 RepID=A0A366DDE0_9NOCA|nr:hypothetical protein [Nocardia puris]RBO87955.1 hypothetical protein DFR74_110211 [Nocardia puris]